MFTKRDSFTSPCLTYKPFISFSRLVALAKILVLCWIEGCKVNILALFLILDEIIHSFTIKLHLTCMIFADVLYQAEVVLFYSCFSVFWIIDQMPQILAVLNEVEEVFLKECFSICCMPLLQFLETLFSRKLKVKPIKLLFF